MLPVQLRFAGVQRGCGTVPRLRKPAVEFGAAGDVPPELLDRWHPVWDSVELTSEWLKQFDITIGDKLKYGPANRYQASVGAWMRHVGMTRAMASGYVVIDGERGHELGLYFGGSSRAIHERIAYGGMVSFPNDPPHKRPEVK